MERELFLVWVDLKEGVDGYLKVCEQETPVKESIGIVECFSELFEVRRDPSDQAHIEQFYRLFLKLRHPDMEKFLAHLSFADVTMRMHRNRAYFAHIAANSQDSTIHINAEAAAKALQLACLATLRVYGEMKQKHNPILITFLGRPRLEVITGGATTPSPIQ